MKLVSLRVRNHKSLSEEVELDFRKPGFDNAKTIEEKTSLLYETVGIYGANASGKSTVIDVLAYIRAAIRSSSGRWQESVGMVRAPFALSEDKRNGLSEYGIEFIHDRIQYNYSFIIASEGVLEEVLSAKFSSRWTKLLYRNAAEKELKIRPKMAKIGQLSSRELALSRALLVDNPDFAPIAQAILMGLEIVPLGDEDRVSRLRVITDSLIEGGIDMDDLISLVRAADVGIANIRVDERELSPKLQKVFRFLKKVESDERAKPDEEAEIEGNIAEISDDDTAKIVRSLRFTHESITEGDVPSFRVRDESSGTIAWITMVVAVVDVLKKGALLCVDELDSSLHPHLASTLISLFLDKSVNVRGAQLLFTSHNAYFLSPLSDLDLEPGQIWFTEKDRGGVTDLFCLDQFDIKSRTNVAKQYLEGRYGATPRLAPSLIQRMIECNESAAR